MNNVAENQFLITPDLSEAVELGGIPAGIYSVRITNVELKQTKAGTGSYLQWELTLFGAEGELSRYNNWKVTHRTMTSGKGAGMLKSFYKAATNTDLTGAFDAQSLLSKEVQITLVEGKDQSGQPSQYPDVKSVKPLTPF